MDRRLPFICRSRKLDDRRHAQHSLLAEAVEKYANAKPEDQPELSAKLAQDATPELCYWMVRTLGESDAKFAGDLLARWRKKPGDLPLRAQIALDEVLCAKERADWFSTPERTALLKSWVTGKADEYHTQRVLSRLDMASQHDQLRGDKAIELVQISTSNKDWRNEDRRNAIWFVGLLARRMVDHQATYEWLFEQMRSNPDLDMRRTAAGVVGSLLLQPKRIQAVEDYLATEEKDATIIKNLRAAVKKAKEADKK